MTLAELVREIAGQLGTGWRTGNYHYESGRVPIIVSRTGMLVFGPLDASQLGVSLITGDGQQRSITVHGNQSAMEVTRHIREYLLGPALVRTETWKEQRAREMAWENEWCAQFTAFSRARRMWVRFDIDRHAGVLVSLRAEFSSDNSLAPACAITVSPFGFPPRVEYYTQEAQLKKILADLTQPPQEAPRRRLLSWRRPAIA